MTESWHEREARMTAQATANAGLIRERLAVDEAAANAAASAAGSTRGDLAPEWRSNGRDVCGGWGVVAQGAQGEIGNEVGAHIARHDPRRLIDQCGSIGDALADLERIKERSPDPDSRMWARSAIVALRRIWEPDE